MDENIDLERRTLNSLFRVKPGFSFIDDGNAIEAKALRGDDTTEIQIGVGLIEEERRVNPQHWELAVIGVLAHEWAHAFQYESDLQEQRYMWETHADYLAGWYLGTKLASGVIAIDPGPFSDTLYRKGSTQGYFDPDAYGSSDSRIEAMMAGFEFALDWARQHPRPLIYEAATAGYSYVRQTK